MKVPIRIMALCAVVAAVGCGGGSSSGGSAASSPAISTTSSTPVSYTPANVLAGLPVEPSTDKKPYANLVASAKFGARPDPFLLTPEEAAYDKKQNVERVMGTMGGFTTQYDIPADEPQPYRRLAGIVVGDSVLAIIDMGDGRAATIIRPGMKIPNTEWTVVSIDQDKAILHRDVAVGPHTVSVRLESPPPGMTGGGSTGFTGGGPTGPMGPQGPGNQRRGGKGMPGIG